MIGRVIFKVAQSFLIQDCDTKEQVKSFIRKKTKSTNTILVGDMVEYTKHDSEYIIEKILERKNWLIRPRAANVDYIFLVYSVKEPDYNSFLLNKFLAFYESRNIKNVIIYFSKMDLLSDDEKKEINIIINSYKNDGYIVFSNLEKEEKIDEIKQLFKDNMICFAGQSGVGKSTFINYLIPEINLRTQEISNALNRGKHTTTSSIIIPFNEGYLIDTPGFSSLDLNMSKLELACSYHDFRSNAVYCKFKDCLHKNEKDCQIKKMVDENKIDNQRYQDYLKFLDSLN